VPETSGGKTVRRVKRWVKPRALVVLMPDVVWSTMAFITAQKYQGGDEIRFEVGPIPRQGAAGQQDRQQRAAMMNGGCTVRGWQREVTGPEHLDWPVGCQGEERRSRARGSVGLDRRGEGWRGRESRTDAMRRGWP